ncbi:MAG: hypothetical protein WAN79_06900, partial [Opitutaceae bacterium]
MARLSSAAPFLAAIVLAAGPVCRAQDAAARGGKGAFDVRIRVDAGSSPGEARPVWRFFGCDEPNYATMKDGQRLMGELGELRPGAVY